MQAIGDIAAALGIGEPHVIPYGRAMAKLDAGALATPRRRAPARLVLVSAMTPTRAGEGKTTVAIGLGDAFTRQGRSACVALREPSLGPCLGIKGGGTGGGRAHIVPADRVNLHFTGDFHAITSAHNLLAAVADNHLHRGSDLDLDPRRVMWPRVMDMDDRALRHVLVGLGGEAHGVPRETGFDITAASELMAMLCLAEDMDDMRARVDRTLIGHTRGGQPVCAGRLGVTGAVLALLGDALMPNLVQTAEGTPVVVHGGPFANIAHGCNSVLATRMALHHADWVITEAGFGVDLGVEKFVHLKCRSAALAPDIVVVVATVRALKLHGGAALDDLGTPDPRAVEQGLFNLHKHIESVSLFQARPVVALNRFATDTDEELRVVQAFCADVGVEVAVCDPYSHGGAGATDLAQAIIQHVPDSPPALRYLYQPSDPVRDKIHVIATQVYGADRVVVTRAAERDLDDVERLGYGHLPVCMAKTPSSLSDDPTLLGRPRGFAITVHRVQINAGAGFLVALCGDVVRMPGLPSSPRAERIDIDAHGNVRGLD